MKDVYVNFDGGKNVQPFVSALTCLDGDFELRSENHILDARSLMGIFSFDLSRPVLLRIYNDNESVLNALNKYLIKE